MEYLRLGQISKPFGLEGQVRCYSLTDFASSRFHIGTKLRLTSEKTGQSQEVTVSSFRDAGAYYFLGFKEIKTIDEAKAIQGNWIEIDKASAPLPKGYYRLEDLKGCSIIDAKNGNPLGTVTNVLSYSSTKTLVVTRQEGKSFYVPFVMDEFIAAIDIEKKKITINVMEGLL